MVIDAYQFWNPVGTVLIGKFLDSVLFLSCSSLRLCLLGYCCHPLSYPIFSMKSCLCLQLNQRRQWQPTPVLLPENSHGWRSLVGCSPLGHEESDMTERLHSHFSLSCIGEGNGNPLQCSCLENPRNGGAWWAAVYGVAQSRTWLKRLSSSTYIQWNIPQP